VKADEPNPRHARNTWRCGRHRWRRCGDRKRGVELDLDDPVDDHDDAVHNDAVDNDHSVDDNAAERKPVGQLSRHVTATVLRGGVATAVAALLLVVVAGSASAGTGLVAIGAGLRGPSGAQATVYATGLQHVSAIAVDSRGRLWVTTSAATGHSDDGLYVISRAGATPIRVLHLVEPLGLVWSGKTLYVAARGQVVAFTHLVGDRFRRRSVILRGPDPKAANNTILVLPNGRLMVSVSATCDDCRQSSRYSAAIVTFDRDGGRLRVYARGIRDAYGLALSSGTLLASVNQRDDLGTRTPGDWLAVVRRGQNWGFPACYGQGGSTCRNVPKPLAVLDRHAGAGAVAVVGTSAIVTEWATGKVLRVPLTGSAHAATAFLTGLENPLAATTIGRKLLVGDWTTGRIYSVTTRA
jgi:hypothetical protein